MKIDDARKAIHYYDIVKQTNTYEIERNLEALQQQGYNVKNELEKIGFNTPNLYQELEMSDKYFDAHDDISYPGDVVQLHSHTFYEILYCKTGNVQYILGNQRYRIHHGDVIIITPGTSHRPLYLDHITEPYRRFALWINPAIVDKTREFFDEQLPESIQQSSVIRTSKDQRSTIEHMFEKCCQEFMLRKDGYRAVIFSNIVELAVRLYRTRESIPQIKEEEPELIDEITEYIEKHLSEKLCLADVAAAFAVSESTVSHLFSKTRNTSFHRWVTQRRLIAAKNMIQQNIPMEIISKEVGFGDYATFYKSFKKEYGISPTQYKNIVLG